MNRGVHAVCRVGRGLSPGGAGRKEGARDGSGGQQDNGVMEDLHQGLTFSSDRVVLDKQDATDDALPPASEKTLNFAVGARP